jgi:glyoxylase-like metal-dependent hydrolase (beta-lactamase superfamily II)
MAEDWTYRAAPGEVQRPEPGLRLILAPNPSPMTLHGTNTYLLGTGAVAVVDPGPDDPRHLAAIVGALAPGEAITHIFVTHAHLDHSPLARALSKATGAPVLAFGDAVAGRSATMAALAASGAIRGGEGVDTIFIPDLLLPDSKVVAHAGWSLRAIHTPGHFGNHLCFATRLNDRDVMFTGDHVMGWASSLVSPPDGDMGAFMQSLDRLETEQARRYYPAHGAPVEAPHDRLRSLRSHRQSREAQIVAALGAGFADVPGLTRRIYVDTPAALRLAAERNVLAHLIDLTERSRVACDGPITAGAFFRLAAGMKTL